MELTELQKKLAEQLLLSVINCESYVEYNELASRVDPPIFWRQVGREIGKVSELCNELGLPLLSAKVVSKGQRKAGTGFFELMKQLSRYDPNVPEDVQFHNELKAIRECREWYRLADYLGLDLPLPRPETDFRYAEEVQTDGVKTLVEGSVKQITVNAYERNPEARKRCIERRGAKCAICGFYFAEHYGKNFEGLIHVHHLRPLHTLGEEYTVDPETDLIPVCPNCHLALHAKPGGVYTPEELIRFMEAAKTPGT